MSMLGCCLSIVVGVFMLCFVGICDELCVLLGGDGMSEVCMLKSVGGYVSVVGYVSVCMLIVSNALLMSNATVLVRSCSFWLKNVVHCVVDAV